MIALVSFYCCTKIIIMKRKTLLLDNFNWIWIVPIKYDDDLDTLIKSTVNIQKKKELWRKIKYKIFINCVFYSIVFLYKIHFAISFRYYCFKNKKIL